MIHALYQLARLYGIQTAYYDVAHRRQPATVDSLLAVLQSLGAPLTQIEDVPAAWREQRQALWQQPLEPVVVAWEGEPFLLEGRLPATKADAALVGHLRLETGEEQSWQWRGTELPVLKTADVEGTRYVVKSIRLPGKLPWGYHRFTLEVGGKSAETLVVAAPRKAYQGTPASRGRTWGVFLPLYALHTQKGWGSGDFSDLETLLDWVAARGGRVVATLPLLATFLDEPFAPSPYTPASRLLWNEFYLDISQVPELAECPPAQALLASAPFHKEIEALRRLPMVDYRRQMALKRRALEELSRCYFSQGPDHGEKLRRFGEAHPLVEDYARFRATGEKRHLPWRSWPKRLREGRLKEGDYDEEARRYHLYAQWLTHQQIQALSEKAQRQGLELYLDFPLGVHPDSYDVWRNQDLFVQGVTAGAPPDAVFTSGQDWEFPPLHPDRLRQQGYRYYIACLRHHLRQADLLRLDHLMGFHRLFWIPKGLSPSQGVYGRYRPEEFYAILALESQRHKALIIGEDLGMVPREVRPAMSRHGLHRLYVLHYELAAHRQRALRRVPPQAVASLNTHDMPPFAAFWRSLDIPERRKLGLLDEASAQKEQQTRRAMKEALARFLQRQGWAKAPLNDAPAALRASLAFLSASPAQTIIVNLEDLWQETQPQNVPGTKDGPPNWQRKARYSFEAFCQSPQVLDMLQEIDHLRKRGPHEPSHRH